MKKNENLRFWRHDDLLLNASIVSTADDSLLGDNNVRSVRSGGWNNAFDDLANG